MKREKHYPDKTQCQRKKVRMIDVIKVDLNKIKFDPSKSNMSVEELKKRVTLHIIKRLYEEALKQGKTSKHSLQRREKRLVYGPVLPFTRGHESGQNH